MQKAPPPFFLICPAEALPEFPRPATQSRPVLRRLFSVKTGLLFGPSFSMCPMRNSLHHSSGPVRSIYCPICASECRQQMKHQVRCPEWGGFSPQLEGSIRAAVYGVDRPKNEPRAPALAPWLWCPSCTGELDEYDEVGRFLRCLQCGLHLRGVSLVELIEAKDDHPAPDLDN